MAKGFDLANDSMKVVYGFLGIVLLLLFSAYLLPEVSGFNVQSVSHL